MWGKPAGASNYAIKKINDTVKTTTPQSAYAQHILDMNTGQQIKQWPFSSPSTTPPS